MTMAANRPFRPLSSVSTFCAVALLAALGSASAQQLYRSVDANGRVVFSDQPPAAVGKAAPAPARAGATPAATTAATTSASTAGLPFELRQVAQRYPVLLYTGDDCAPCDTGRSLLTTRGVPFEERTVKTPQDTDALSRLSGQASLPLLSIGTQQLKGYSDAEWSQYLDAAGYPKSNQLPNGYRPPAAAPLVALQAAPAARPAAGQPPFSPTSTQAPAVPAPAVDGPTPGNPAGIRF